MQLFATEHPFTSGVDISSTAFWTQTPLERDAAFAVLRREAPVSWHPPLEPSGRPQLTEAGFWAVTLAADIHYVSQHPELFSSALGGGPQVRRTEEVAGGTTVFNLDPPEHTRYRNMISAAFTPKGVARISSKIEERAERIVSAVVGAGEFDFVARVSSQLPMLTIADMFGVPDDQIEAFTAAGNNLVDASLLDSVLPEGVDPAAFIAEHLATVAGIGIELVHARRSDPADDIATALAQAEVDGRPLGDVDVAGTTLALCIAGNDTTKHSTSWTALNLWEHPDQADWLRDDFEGRIGHAVDEFVRHATPVMSFARTATQDTELGGQEIAAGDRVVMWYCSGNRDESVFPDPHRFDLSRPRANHVAFGGRGVHYCLGNVVAKAQLRAIFRQVLTKLPELEVVGEPDLMHSEFFNGIRRLPVTSN